MINLDLEQNLKIASRVGITEDKEFDSELVEIYAHEVKSIKDINQIFHLCDRYKYTYNVCILDNRLIIFIKINKKEDITLQFKTDYDVFTLKVN